jgi:hypothetical protein
MEKILTAIDITDNGGRRRVRDRRFLVSVPFAREHRTNWDRRSGYDRRILSYPENRRIAEASLLIQAFTRWLRIKNLGELQ